MSNVKIGLMAIVLLAMTACGTANESKSNDEVELLGATAFKEKMASISTYNLLDVRSPEEYSMNHIKGAQNVNVNGSDFEEKIALLDKSIPVLAYCKSGSRTRSAVSSMRKIGIKVYELDGGLLKWQSAGYPVEVDSKSQKEGYTLADYNDVISNNAVVLVDFHAVWCGPCKKMAPHIKSIKNKYKEELTVIKVDTDKSMEVSNHFGISAIPLIKVYKNGKEVYSKVGYHKLNELESLAKKYL